MGRKYYIGSVCEHSAVSAGPDILLSLFFTFFFIKFYIDDIITIMVGSYSTTQHDTVERPQGRAG